MITVVDDMEPLYELNGAGLLKYFLSVNRRDESSRLGLPKTTLS